MSGEHLCLRARSLPPLCPRLEPLRSDGDQVTCALAASLGKDYLQAGGAYDYDPKT